MTRDEADRLVTLIKGKAARVKATVAEVSPEELTGEGEFSAIVSTFGPPPDTQGDVIAPGAFDGTIQRWLERGDWPAIWFMHQTDRPDAAVGVVKGMQSIGRGLLVVGQLDLDHAPAREVWKGMLAGRLKEFSIGYAVIAEHHDQVNGWNVLDELEILEVSIVAAGANRYTELLAVKAAPAEPDYSLHRDLERRLAEAAGLSELVNSGATEGRRYEQLDRVAQGRAVKEIRELQRRIDEAFGEPRFRGMSRMKDSTLVDEFIREDRAARRREREELERRRP